MRLFGTFTASQLSGIDTAIQLQNRNDRGAPKTSGFISVSCKDIDTIYRQKLLIILTTITTPEREDILMKKLNLITGNTFLQANQSL